MTSLVASCWHPASIGYPACIRDPADIRTSDLDPWLVGLLEVLRHVCIIRYAWDLVCLRWNFAELTRWILISFESGRQGCRPRVLSTSCSHPECCIIVPSLSNPPTAHRICICGRRYDVRWVSRGPTSDDDSVLQWSVGSAKSDGQFAISGTDSTYEYNNCRVYFDSGRFHLFLRAALTD